MVELCHGQVFSALTFTRIHNINRMLMLRYALSRSLRARVEFYWKDLKLADRCLSVSGTLKS